jgi:hypothetical protein
VRRGIGAVSVAVCAALAMAGPAAASTIGQTFGDGASCPQGYLAAEPSYSVPAAGTISSISVQTTSSTTGQQLDLLILRPTGIAGQFTVIARTGTVTLGGSGNLDTFSLGSPVNVQPGDVLGAYTISALNDCLRSGSGIDFASTTDPSVGDTFTADTTAPYDINESARFSTVDTTALDSRSATPATGPMLDNGVSYTVTVSGTFSPYRRSLMDGSTKGWKVCGSPESAPMFGTGGPVGQDAQYIFARPQSSHCDPKYTFPHKYGASAAALKFDTGDSSGFKALAPDPGTAYNLQHTYTYTVTGAGHPLQVRLEDSNYNDNYGVLHIETQVSAT